MLYLVAYFGQHFIAVTKGSDEKNVEREKFILTHGFSSQSATSVALGLRGSRRHDGRA